MRVIITIILLVISISTYSRDWSAVLSAIAQVESNNNPRARNGDAVGLLQIRPVLVKDVNRILKKRNINKRYTLADRYNPQKSREMFIIYQSFYNPRGNVEKAIRMWNGGCGYSNGKTNGYYRKVRKAMYP